MPFSTALSDRFLWLASLATRRVGPSGSLAHRLSDLGLRDLDVIDCGCGLNASVVSRQVLLIPFRRLVSVDGCPTVIEQAKTRASRAAQREFLCLDLLDVPHHYRWQRSFDVALCLDVLEHLPKPAAYQFLVDLERVVKRRIVIWLPLGELRVDADPHGRGNDLELHRSFWQSSELAELGYATEILPKFHSARYDAAWAVKSLGQG